jgi:hypothetical protein
VLAALVALQKGAFEQYGDGVLELEEDQVEDKLEEDSEDSDDVTEVARPRSPHQWPSFRSQELEEQVERKLIDMNIPDAHAWARKAVAQVGWLGGVCCWEGRSSIVCPREAMEAVVDRFLCRTQPPAPHWLPSFYSLQPNTRVNILDARVIGNGLWTVDTHG